MSERLEGQRIPVARLPVYSRAEEDLFHWTGRLVVAEGQTLTPDVVGALSDAGVSSVYTDGERRVRPEKLTRIDVFSLQEGRPLSFSIFDDSGKLLARRGDRLSQEQMDILHRRGQEKVYHYRSGEAGQVESYEEAYVSRVRRRLDERIVFGPGLEVQRSGLPISRQVRSFGGRARPASVLGAYESFYMRAVERTSALWDRLGAGRCVKSAEILELTEEIIDRFAGEREVMAALAFADLALPLYPKHALDTAVYSLFLAQRTGLNRSQARDVVAAGLFHDVGYVRIPRRLLDAERSLTKGERRILFHHIEHALFLMGRVEWQGEEWRIGVYQHHERGTGAGYPSGYRAEKLHEYSRLLAVADVFAALVSERPHRGAYRGARALQLLLKMGAVGLLDAKMARLLAGELSLYPVGSWVRLSGGETARVAAASREPLKPWVGVIFTSEGERLREPRIIDLSRRPSMSIAREERPFEEPLAGF